jgi:hypothetical protein
MCMYDTNNACIQFLYTGNAPKDRDINTHNLPAVEKPSTDQKYKKKLKSHAKDGFDMANRGIY